MGWSLPGIRRSVIDWLGLPQPSISPSVAVIEDIRGAMLGLVDTPEYGRFEHLLRRIRYAESATELWYLRADLLTVLSAELGETGAGKALAPVTAMFDRIVPPGMRSRQSPLAG